MILIDVPGRTVYAQTASTKLDSNSVAFGFIDHLERTYRMPLANKILDDAVDLGLTWKRQDFPLSYVYENQNRYNWAKLDSIVRELKKRNFHILGILGRPPKSINVGRKPVGPNRKDSFSKQLVDDNKFYAGIDSITSHYSSTVDAWELINEPNTKMTAKMYAKLVSRAVPIIKKNDPTAKIVMGGLDSFGSDPKYKILYNNHGKMSKISWLSFIDSLYNKNVIDLFDVLNIHWFYGHGTDSFDKLKSNLTKLSELSNGKEIWLTEFGCITKNNFIGRSQQDANLKRALIIALQFPDVSNLFFADGLWDGAEGAKSNNPFNYTGLFDMNGKPKPAAEMVKKIITNVKKCGRPYSFTKQNIVAAPIINYTFKGCKDIYTSRLPL